VGFVNGISSSWTRNRFVPSPLTRGADTTAPFVVAELSDCNNKYKIMYLFKISKQLIKNTTKYLFKN
jgi:hypothetical protein